MKKLNLIPLFAFLFLVSSCNDDSQNPDVIQLLINSSVEAGSSAPNKWWPNEGDYTCLWTDEYAYSDSKSLKISSDKDIGNFGYWVQTVTNDIPYGRRLKLSSMIKLDEIDPGSDGVSIVIRGDNAAGDSEFFYTTQGDVPIRGDKDWQEYTLEMKSNIPESVDKILVFLVLLDDTRGRVYFDDITLETIN